MFDMQPEPDILTDPLGIGSTTSPPSAMSPPTRDPRDIRVTRLSVEIPQVGEKRRISEDTAGLTSPNKRIALNFM